MNSNSRPPRSHAGNHVHAVGFEAFVSVYIRYSCLSLLHPSLLRSASTRPNHRSQTPWCVVALPRPRFSAPQSYVIDMFPSDVSLSLRRALCLPCYVLPVTYVTSTYLYRLSDSAFSAYYLYPLCIITIDYCSRSLIIQLFWFTTIDTFPHSEFQSMIYCSSQYYILSRMVLVTYRVQKFHNLPVN